MKEYFEFDQDDKKLWLGFAAAALLYIIAFTLFWGGLAHQIEKAVFFVLEDILPGYVIMKLFLGNLSLSDNKITDRIMVSFALSLFVMEVPFYLLKYLRPYESNTDEKAWGMVSDTTVTLLLLILVFGIAFGVKYYQNKTKGAV
ncbi:MAG: hypothetical protein ACKN9T_05070 [Candidatus Methylumidiphilus sp.]